MKYLFLILIFFSCVTSDKTASVTINLDGSRSRIVNGDGHGYIKDIQWRQVTGTPATISNPKSIVAITQVKSGTYSWELRGIDNLGNMGKDTFKIQIK